MTITIGPRLSRHWRPNHRWANGSGGVRDGLPFRCEGANRRGWVVSMALLASSVVVSPAWAQGAGVPALACQAPTVPEQFKNDQDQDRFVDAARAYETCMQNFIEARQDSAKQHSEAGNTAAAAFNEFAAAVAAIKPPPQR